jgi:hypothetical protein
MLYQTSITLFGPPSDVMNINESPFFSNSHIFQPLYIFFCKVRHHMIVIYIETFSMNHLM